MTYPALTTAVARFLEAQPPGSRVVIVCPPALQHRVETDVALLDPCGAVTSVVASTAVAAGDVYLIRPPDDPELPIVYDIPPVRIGPRAWWLDIEYRLPLPADVALIGGVA